MPMLREFNTLKRLDVSYHGKAMVRDAGNIIAAPFQLIWDVVVVVPVIVYNKIGLLQKVPI